ncbi:MAG TPA: hypothetical protein ACFYD3_04360 [Candidatus Hypogeohydataceae bacterium YC41]
MATCIMLIHLTQQGIQNIKESPSREEKAKKSLSRHGCGAENGIFGNGPV